MNTLLPKTTEAQLCAEYTVWLQENGLPSMSADELYCEIMDTATNEQLQWLIDFSFRWNLALHMERNAKEIMLRKQASIALEALLLSYAKADEARGSGGKIDWDDIDAAFELAKDALPGRYEAIVAELVAQDEEDEHDKTSGQ